MAASDIAQSPSDVEMDDRGRVSLARVIAPDLRRHRYLVTVQPDGTIVMVPAVIMTELEARFLANPDLVAKVHAIEADPSQAVPLRSRARTAKEAGGAARRRRG